MALLAHILATPGMIRVVPAGAGRRFDLLVTVRTPQAGPGQTVPLPAGRGLATVAIPPDAGACEVTVRPRRLLRRLRHGRQQVRKAPSERPLRVLITGSGRCGTRTLARFLAGARFADGTPVDARHEPLSEVAVPALIDGDLDTVRAIQAGLGHNLESAPYYSLYPDAIHAERVLHVIRDGRRVVQSGLNRGWYRNDSPWNRLKPPFSGDPFARSCHLWRQTCETSAELAHATFRLEDLAADPDARTALCEAAGVVPDGRALPRANQGRDPSRWDGWSAAQRDVFTAIAGPVMDRFYPGWHRQW